MMDIIVDTVSEVMDIDVLNIESTPTCRTKLDTDYILGMGKVKEGESTLSISIRCLLPEILSCLKVCKQI